MSPFARFSLFLAVAVTAAFSESSSRAAVVINELVAGASDRLLQYQSDGVQRVGTGTPWYQPTFNDSAWATGAGPFGYGTLTNTPTPIATRVEALMRYLTPTLYLRRGFTVSDVDAARPDAVQLVIEYNDGFVAYLNGAEITRRNGGPAKKFIYHDQSAYNRESFSATAPIPTSTTSEILSVGVAANLLKAGNNVLAIHALNANASDATFYVKASLRINGATVTPLVDFSDQWKYLQGVVEPSGNLYDPTQLGTGKLNAPWGRIDYDDADWSSGSGPIGAGSVAGVTPVTSVPGVIGVTPSIYTRAIFTADAAALAETNPLQLVVQYDDGFVAYINGVEVARRRIGTANTYTPNTAVADSDNTSTPVAETISLDIPSRLLVQGNNVLAIQFHNYSLSSPDIYMRADLRTGSARTLVASNTTWKYLAGTQDPVPEVTGEEEEATPEGPDSAPDWIELYNSGDSDVSLAGYALTDDPATPRKWVLPNVSIPAGGYLVVIADGLDLTSNPGGYLHTNFSLDQDGEYVGLYDGSGSPVDQIAPNFPRQFPFQSYARDGNGAWKYTDAPSPGAANGGTFIGGIVATPTVSVPGRFYASNVSVSLSCSTPGAIIRFTTDGSEPSAGSGIAPPSLSFTSSGVLRARAFATGMMPSDTITHTYLIGQAAARQSLPAVCLSGDLTKTFYRPFGIFAISPNTSNAYTGGIWSQYIGNSSGNLTAPNVPADPTAYNAPMQSGKPAERPISLEILNTGATQDLRAGAGLRTAGSPYSRPRYVLTNHNSATPNSQSPWSSSATEKPQLNLFFRDDIGGRPLTYPFVPLSKVRSYENLRLRAGKNDISNPFTRDELSRRLLNDMGQVVVLGDFVNVYVNGIFKGYFNICERPREKFFQEARQSTKKFDTRYITVMTDGDPLAYNELVNFARTNDPSSNTAYQGLASRLDVVNFADYLILNAYAAMADWPGNNYVMDRERSAAGKYRFSIWDGEGGFGGFSRNPGYRNTFTGDLFTSNPTGETIPARLFYTQLRKSAEWRLLFADRVQKHFFNNGALDTANFTARYNELKNKILPMIQNVSGAAYSEYLPVWLNGIGDTTRLTLSGGTTGSVVNSPSRRKVLFDGFIDDTAGGTSVQGLFVSEGLWPATRSPVFSQNGGTVTAGFQLAMTNPNAGGTIYFTTNGADPRNVGGAIAGQAYAGAISINQSSIVKARVLNGSVWSPLMEATFTVAQPVPLQITEIMYNPLPQGAVSGDEFEFIELKNVGTGAINLNGMQFTDGINFTFQNGAKLDAGEFLILAKNSTQFSARYPGVPVAGVYGSNGVLANSGELLTLKDIVGNIVFSMSFLDRSPWPASADGYGNSLVPVSPNANPNVSDPANWRASAMINGSPGQDDPTPTAPTIYINEVLTNPAPGDSDAIELYNPSAQTADLGGWFITDVATSPKKFQIRANAIVPASGYLVLRAADITPGPGFTSAFSLSEDAGELRLNSADASGNLTGYSHGCRFFGAAPGVSFGRLINSAGAEKFPPQRAVTLGSANAGPKVGPVVISEIMYNPGSGGDEFIELRNITGETIPLFDPANPNVAWHVTNLGGAGTDFVLPTGVSLPPRGFAILTEIDPSVFRIKYNLPLSIPVFRYTGALDNAGEQVALLRPGTAYLNQANISIVPFIEADAVEYSPFAPWPTVSNGTGPSDERINWRAYGDDPANWRASTTSGGNPGAVAAGNFATWQSLYFTPAETADPIKGALGADPDGDGYNNLTECALGLDPWRPDQTSAISASMEMDGSAGPFLTLRYRRNVSAQGFQWVVDTADAPGNWQLGTGVTVGNPVNNGDGTETVTQRDTVPSDTVSERLIRLRVLGN